MGSTLLSKLGRHNIRHAEPTPGRSALLVIDMQRYFGEMAAPIVDNIAALLAAARGSGVPVVYTQHGHRDPAHDGGMLLEWWGELIVHGSSDWELLPQLAPAAGEPVFAKNRYSAFAGTELEGWLRGRGLEELIVTGVMTNCCCETTARDAFVRDFRVFFAVDATATVDQELHLASLKTLAYGFAYLLDTDGLLRALQGGRARQS